MINKTYVESTIENIKKIKEELLNDCGFDIDHENEDKIIISCGGKCWGHDNEILEICKDIKLLSQHIDIDSDDFDMNYYYKNNKFSCNFGWDDEGGYYLCNKNITTEQLNILVDENILSVVNGEYVDNEKFPFCRKTRNIYCNVCKEHHDSKFKCLNNEDFPYNQKKKIIPTRIEDKTYNEDSEEEIQPTKKIQRKNKNIN